MQNLKNISTVTIAQCLQVKHLKVATFVIEFYKKSLLIFLNVPLLQVMDEINVL